MRIVNYMQTIRKENTFSIKIKLGRLAASHVILRLRAVIIAMSGENNDIELEHSDELLKFYKLLTSFRCTSVSRRKFSILFLRLLYESYYNLRNSQRTVL